MPNNTFTLATFVANNYFEVFTFTTYNVNILKSEQCLETHNNLANFYLDNVNCFKQNKC